MAVVAGLVLVQCAVAAQVQSARPIYVPNEYIIRAQAGASAALVEQAVTRMGATLVSALPVADTYLIRMGRGVNRQTAVANSRGTLGKTVRWVIESVQPNYKYYACATPNDDLWSWQWDMKLINAPQAWEVEKGSDIITVAVIDTGVGNHPELVNRIVTGYDFVDNDSDPSNDLAMHGTHVAGTIAAQGNNKTGICGVCWDGVKIMPIRVLDATGGGTTEVVVNGEDYALQHGVQVVNMSLGGTGDDPTEHAKIPELARAGVVSCASAGNDGDGTSEYPAGYPEVISVAAVVPDDTIASYSSFGKVDIAAPGGDYSQGTDSMVLSTLVSFDDQGQPQYYGYGFEYGTSMACPHVSGAAALLMSHGVTSALDVRNRLLTGARPPRTGALDTVKYGAGILDIQGALFNARVKINKPGKGATVGANPDFKIAVQGVSLDSIRIYLDYADLNDDGAPDDPNEGIVMSGSTISPDIPTISSYNPTGTSIEFSWSDISNGAALSSGAHNICITADAAAAGEGSVSDWLVFSVARRKITRGIHLFAFPYDLFDAATERTTQAPSKILPGAQFGFTASPRSTLQRYLAAPRSSLDSTPIGYEIYAPSNSGERVWNSPLTLLSGADVPTGGGYYYDNVARQQKLAFPAGSGFWLILPTDVWVDESIPTLESKTNFDGSKGFDISLYKGWNMIGNPYAHQVPWRAVLFTYRGQTKTLLDAELAGWVRSTIYTYGTAGVSTYVGITDRDLLEPYQGYWLLSLLGGASQSESLVLNILP